MNGRRILRLVTALVFLCPAAAEAAVFNVRDHGAKGDKTTSDTKAIQATIDACSKAGGGTVADAV